MRFAYSMFLSALISMTSAVACGQGVGPGRAGGAGPPEDVPMFEIYQAIFSLLFSGRSSPASDEEKAIATSRLQAIGIESKAASALASYVGNGLAQQYEFTE